jgi:copper chaperone CopZ
MSNTIHLSIPGMKCAGCVSAIEKALGEQAGVVSSQVDLETKTALVESDIAVSELNEAIKSAGFDATEITAGQGNS